MSLGDQTKFLSRFEPPPLRKFSLMFIPESNTLKHSRAAQHPTFMVTHSLANLISNLTPPSIDLPLSLAWARGVFAQGVGGQPLENNLTRSPLVAGTTYGTAFLELKDKKSPRHTFIQSLHVVPWPREKNTVCQKN